MNLLRERHCSPALSPRRSARTWNRIAENKPAWPLVGRELGNPFCLLDLRFPLRFLLRRFALLINAVKKQRYHKHCKEYETVSWPETGTNYQKQSCEKYHDEVLPALPTWYYRSIDAGCPSGQCSRHHTCGFGATGQFQWRPARGMPALPLRHRHRCHTADRLSGYRAIVGVALAGPVRCQWPPAHVLRGGWVNPSPADRCQWRGAIRLSVHAGHRAVRGRRRGRGNH